MAALKFVNNSLTEYFNFWYYDGRQKLSFILPFSGFFYDFARNNDTYSTVFIE